MSDDQYTSFDLEISGRLSSLETAVTELKSTVEKCMEPLAARVEKIERHGGFLSGITFAGAFVIALVSGRIQNFISNFVHF